MGARKANKAAQLKAEKKQKSIAIMRDCPTSPRKMRLVADIIRGVDTLDIWIRRCYSGMRSAK